MALTSVVLVDSVYARLTGGFVTGTSHPVGVSVRFTNKRTHTHTHTHTYTCPGVASTGFFALIAIICTRPFLAMYTSSQCRASLADSDKQTRPIGGHSLNGISNGERKRVSIGVELITRPMLPANLLNLPLRLCSGRVPETEILYVAHSQGRGPNLINLIQ